MTHQPITNGTEGRSSLKSAPDAVGFDLFRLDCAVDALRDQSLSQNDRAELARISSNLIDLMETPNGHAH